MQIKVTIGAVVGIAAGLMLAVGAGCSGDSNPTNQPFPDGGGPGGDAGLDAGHGADGGADAGITLTVRERILVVDSIDGGADAGAMGDGGMRTDGGTDGGATVDGGTLPRVDPNLVNPWGIAITDAGNIWISDNGTGMSSIYNATGAQVLPAVTIPAMGGSDGGMSDGGGSSSPTGVVWNPDQSKFGSDKFIFVTEDGTIAGWQSGTTAAIRVDNSGSGAVYKGATILGDRLFVANFNSGKVEVYNSNYQPVAQFTDPNVPGGFAPFNVLALNGKLYVTFAKQDPNKKDDVPAVGNGFIDTIDPTSGTAQRLVSNGPLNSPWGLAIAPSSFGPAAGKLIVGNFGDGLIHIVDPQAGAVVGSVRQAGGSQLTIDGLWGLAFTPGATGDAGTTLFFTAGPNDEANGQFGTLTPATP